MTDHIKKILLIIVSLVLFVAPAVFQTVATTTVTSRPHPVLYPTGIEDRQLQSKLMGRKMPYSVVLPPEYERTNENNRYAVIYLLHGLTGHYTTWTDKTQLREYAGRYKFIVVTPEGDNGWYTDSISTPNDKYESYIMQELIPEIDAKFRTLSDREHRVIAGLSMGGYGAIKFGLKYSDKFSLVGSFSGALGAAAFNEKNAGAIGKGIVAIYGPDDSATRKANDIFGLVKALTSDKVKALPYIYQSCGTEDFLFQNNRDFDSLLLEKKVPHEYREHPGIHDWVFWNDQVREFLQVAELRLKK